MRRSNKRELLMQLHKLQGNGKGGFKQMIAGQYASKKLDGFQAFWDGGLTRGMFVHDVPWANTEKDTKPFISTGLWTRFGKPIFAPDSWLNCLPTRMLTGEVYAGRGNFRRVSQLCRRHTPDVDAWMSELMFHIFDSPSIEQFSQPGRIKIRYWELDITPVLGKWITNRRKHVQIEDHGPVLFDTFVDTFDKYENDVVTIVPQVLLPFGKLKAETVLRQMFASEVALGGEGLVIRDPGSVWTPYRSHDVLKLKKQDDEEGIVIGYTTGREGLRLGRIGALKVCNAEGIAFKVAGLNERETLLEGLTEAWAISNPDSDLPEEYSHKQIPLGKRITYTYYDKSPDGVPLQPRYMR